MIRKRQKEVLDFVTSFIHKKGYAPSLEDICKYFSFASVSTAHFHIQKLEEAGYLEKETHKSRTLDVVDREKMIKIPLLGIIAAGSPIEAIEDTKMIAIPSSRVPRTGDLFALTVQGESMVEENIESGDTLIVKRQSYADDGQIVVALIDNENATVKKLFHEKGRIRLQPANKKLKPIYIDNRNLTIQGVVHDVIKENVPLNSTLPLIEPRRIAPTHTALTNNNVSYDFYLGDSLDIIPTLDQKYTTIYLDPPFNSNRDYSYSALGENFGFGDKWSVGEYERWLDTIIGLCKTKLNKDGTLFFHISAELSLAPHIILSKHFKKVEPIFWKKAHGKNTVKNKLGAVVDIIYKASDNNPKFNLQYVPLDAYYFENSYRNKDNKGLYALGSIKHDKTRKGHMYSYAKDGIIYEAPYGWKIPKTKLMELLKEDRIHFARPKPGVNRSMLYKKLYKDEVKGKPLSNLWDDIAYITRSTKDERLYPTQKPFQLLKRIVEMSSDPGDWILDPVAGSGTTGAAALVAGRSATLIDISKESGKIIKERMRSLLS